MDPVTTILLVLISLGSLALLVSACTFIHRPRLAGCILASVLIVALVAFIYTFPR